MARFGVCLLEVFIADLVDLSVRCFSQKDVKSQNALSLLELWRHFTTLSR